MTFESLVQELADPSQQVAISKLVGLSGINAGEASWFERAWLEMDDLRRQRLIHELIDLAEASVELNFDAVFLVALRDQPS